MSLMFMPLRLVPVPVQCVVLASVLDVLLSRDVSLQPLVASMEGNVYAVRVEDVHVQFFIGFKSGRAWVHPSFDENADVEVCATTSGFARMTFGHEDVDDLVFQHVLRLSGDSAAMLRFKRLLAAIDIDWERELRQMFGELFGSRVAKAAKALLAAEARLATGLKQRARHYMDDADVPSSARVEMWQAGVEIVMRDANSLQQRLQRLEQHVGGVS